MSPHAPILRHAFAVYWWCQPLIAAGFAYTTSFAPFGELRDPVEAVIVFCFALLILNAALIVARWIFTGRWRFAWRW